MATWQIGLVVALVVVLGGTVALVVWLRRAALGAGEAAAYVREMGGDLVRLPGRLRRVAADARTPRRARWLLIGLAVYVASPIDPIPDFIPVVGHLDELVVVPLVLGWVRRMVPAEVWAEHFPARVGRGDRASR